MNRLGAELIEVKIRSIQADRKRQYVVVLNPVKITRDGEQYRAGELFVPPGRQPEFEYQLRIITMNNIYTARRWLSSKEQTVYINRAVLREAFDNLPGLE